MSDINEITKSLAENILDKIDFLKDKIAVFDIDGVFCRFHYTEGDHLLPCKDADLGTFLVNHNMYNFAKPLKIMQYVVNSLNPDNIFTLSTATIPAKAQKNEWLSKHYPKIKKEKIIYSKNDMEKLEFLKEILANHPDKTVVFIEDTAKTLLNSQEAYPNLYCLHISSFMI